MRFPRPLLLLPLLLGLLAARPAPAPIRVITYNLRLDVASDGPNRWDLRKERVAGLLRYHAPDVLGVQEALPNQLADLETRLPEYAWYGLGRDDGRGKGEFSAVFYRKSRFTLLDKGTFWLSATPEQPGKGWDAAYPRVCSWVKLRDNRSRQTFFHFNTHFDHVGEVARRESARLILARIEALAGGAPVLLTGDFNVGPASEAYRTILASPLLRDTKDHAQTPHYGPLASWATFDVAHGLGDLIDHIFASPAVRVLRHATLTDSENGHYPSDHLPVVADVLL
jgi:endonuclease/exonuclease/phosphatase family metal-dependent hydrolase